jgi:AcrR family transcriptional regulator
MKKSEITKNNILSSAISILRANAHVTFKDISDDCGVNVASINYHFGSKEILIDEIIEKTISDLKTLIQSFLMTKCEDCDLKKVTKNFIDAIYDFAFLNLGILKFLMNPNNKEVLTKFANEFVNVFSVDSDFTIDVTKKIAELSDEQDLLANKIKYTFLISCFVFPLAFDIDVIGTNIPDPFSLKNEVFKNKYIEGLLKILLLKI